MKNRPFDPDKTLGRAGGVTVDELTAAREYYAEILRDLKKARNDLYLLEGLELSARRNLDKLQEVPI